MRSNCWRELTLVFLLALAASLVTSVIYEYQGILPYSRPHIEFENDMGEQCAGWYMNGGGGAILLCEGVAPKIIIMKSSNSGHDSKNVMYA